MEGGGSGGPAPFLLKTYDMVDDSSTDEIVSWSSNINSFVVWNPPEFARLLLPTYFKHNNFSSFIRQLNTYGFRKIDPERWEFANEDFVKDKKHLLKNIHRRKPIHSHSQPQGSAIDPERATYDEEIDRLSRDKAELEANVLRYRQQNSTMKLQLEDLTRRLAGMEQKQENLRTLFARGLQNPRFVDHLAWKIETMDFSAYNKKRRLPQADQSQPVRENNFVDNHSSSSVPEFGNIFHQDFSNKLKLELSPAVSDINLVSHSTQSSSDEGGSPQRKMDAGDPKDLQMRAEGFVFTAEPVELSDTGTSFTFKMDSSLSRNGVSSESPSLLSLQQNVTSKDDSECHLSCHLNLTLSSSPLQVDRSHHSANEVGKTAESRTTTSVSECEYKGFQKNRNLAEEGTSFSSSKEVPANNQVPAAVTAPIRVNDVFWEQFLTERPGSEEASSSYRAYLYDEHEERRPGQGISRNTRGIQRLSL
ncbi:Heat shock factor (HSF)-type, DNA-binding [Dillenia turbinata]|uniref:Heat shock factor (HSF)-type, DNA-binding n=1 Tax=Dillenia turbinata TaxID=194707 RepID=A0AAN8VNR7_9MAGN